MGTINLIIQPTGGAPISTDDYNYQNVDIGVLLNILDRKQLQLTEWDTLTVPALARYVYITHGGDIFQVQDSDYDITDPGGIADGRIYIKVERSGDVLEAEFVDNATGYSWNYVYNGFYHADGSQLLPYVLILDTGDYLKYNLSEIGNKFDIESDTISIGNDLSVENALSCDILTCNGIELENYTTGYHSVAASSTWTPPKGLYLFATNETDADLGFQILISGNWYGDFNFAGLAYCDGTNMRIENRNGATAYTIYYFKYV